MPWNHFRPTPEQIEEECRKIREEWDEETHRRRWVWPVPEHWTPPLVTPVRSHRREEPDPWPGECPLSELSS